MATATIQEESRLESDPLWYKDAIIYELNVRAFHDSNADGKGDFHGLTEKLDYLQELGVTTLWLLPFYPSPLRDDGYDIADYTNIHPTYGTLQDFRMFLREAHRRGLRVITELVVNHTSDQHPWFQRARRSPPGSLHRDFYVWSDTPDKYADARIIFKDFEASNWTWDPVAQSYFWHRFYSHQPDLNYENPEVHKAIFQVVDFWFKLGVDGLRLDAVPYLYEAEGTNCENLPKTHVFLKNLRRYVDANYRDRMLLAEANQWPEDAVTYFGAGDECHMAFHFPIMPRLFMSIRMEDRFPIIDILEQTPALPDNAQWAIFLRNHDELTLEMVTDEERDYMYRVYAVDPQARINLGIRRRLAPLLGNDRRRIELLNGLLFALPGTPVIYYGDEIGMGDNIYLGDRNGVRTPMQWSPDRNAGFSRANPQQLYFPVIIDPEYHYESLNVESQQRNPASLLWWTRRMIALRKRFKAFGSGTIEFLHPENRKVLSFIRHHEEGSVLVVANLSRYVQFVELDLSRYRGQVPVEMFSSMDFPAIGDLPYLLTLGGHDFYWFCLGLQCARAELPASATAELLPLVTVSESWERVFATERGRAALASMLPPFMQRARWFGGKSRRIKNVELREAIPITYEAGRTWLALIQVEYTDGEPERYSLPLTWVNGERAEEILRDRPQLVLARLEIKERQERGVLFDASGERGFANALLEAITGRRGFKSASAEIEGFVTRAFQQQRRENDVPLEPSTLRVEQSNTSINYSNQFIMKFYRRLEEGINPDLELGLFLTKVGFPHVAPLAGALEFLNGPGEASTIAILQGFIPNEGDAWTYTLDNLNRYLDQAQTRPPDEARQLWRPEHLTDLMREELPPLAHELCGPYLDSMQLLGQRTGELHLALASDPIDPRFAPERFTMLFQRALYQSLRNRAGRIFQILHGRLKNLPKDVLEDAHLVYEMRGAVLRRYRAIMEQRLHAIRIRIHGDYHLGQVLFTGKDFVIIDFEGEPAIPLFIRRIKRSPIRDVVGMLRSFSYAGAAALRSMEERGVVGSDGGPLKPWTDLWYQWVSAQFLRSYFATTQPASFLPQGRDELRMMLDIYLLEKAVYELWYELNHRPDWVQIPLKGILQLMQGAE